MEFMEILVIKGYRTGPREVPLYNGHKVSILSVWGAPGVFSDGP